MCEHPPAVRAFDHLPKRVQKKAISIPEVHVHFLAHFDFGASSSAKVEHEPEVVSDADQEVGEPSPSAFKTEDEWSGWEF